MFKTIIQKQTQAGGSPEAISVIAALKWGAAIILLVSVGFTVFGCSQTQPVATTNQTTSLVAGVVYSNSHVDARIKVLNILDNQTVLAAIGINGSQQITVSIDIDEFNEAVASNQDWSSGPLLQAQGIR